MFRLRRVLTLPRVIAWVSSQLTDYSPLRKDVLRTASAPDITKVTKTSSTGMLLQAAVGLTVILNIVCIEAYECSTLPNCPSY